MQNKELIEKWLSGSLSPQEEAIFRQSDDYRDLVELDEALQYYKAPEFDTEAALRSLQARRNSEAKVIQLSTFDTVLKIAAVISIILFGYLLIFQATITRISTEVGQKELVSLPDQSSVRLNASSTLSFSKKEWLTQRQTELTGEAYFIVAKGSKFDVNTEAGTISVLGTEFNVKARPGYFEVTCYEGQVAVVAHQDTVHLLAGNGFRIVKGVKKMLKVDALVPAWTRNESSFDSVPFAEVMAEFERQYGVSIETNNVDLTKLYSGSFTHDDFKVALKSIATPFNLRIEKTTDQHIVLSALEE